MRLTRAQKCRLQQVSEGRIERTGASRCYGSYYNTGFGGKGTYVMWCWLEDNGLIAWEPIVRDDVLGRLRFKAVVTDAGKAALL